MVMVTRTGYLRGVQICVQCGAAQECEWPVILKPWINGLQCSACFGLTCVPVTLQHYPETFDQHTIAATSVDIIERLQQPPTWKDS